MCPHCIYILRIFIKDFICIDFSKRIRGAHKKQQHQQGKRYRFEFLLISATSYTTYTIRRRRLYTIHFRYWMLVYAADCSALRSHSHTNETIIIYCSRRVTNRQSLDMIFRILHTSNTFHFSRGERSMEAMEAPFKYLYKPFFTLPGVKKGIDKKYFFYFHMFKNVSQSFI